MPNNNIFFIKKRFESNKFMDLFTAIQTVLQQLILIVKATIQALPNILIAIVVFIIFWFIAKFSKRLIKNTSKQSCNLGLILALPFPTQQIFHERTNENGDRARQREGWLAKRDNPKPRSIADYLQLLAKGSSDSNSRGNAKGDKPTA